MRHYTCPPFRHTSSKWEMLWRTPRIARKVTDESIKHLTHPTFMTDVFAGGTGIVCYSEDLSSCTSREEFLGKWATFGSISYFHSIKDGPLKNEMVAVTADHVVAEGKTFYSWSGTRAYICHPELGIQLVNVWDRLHYPTILANDDAEDVALLKLDTKSCNDTEIKGDYIHGIGNVLVNPEDIGEYLRVDIGDKLLGNGFVSAMQAFKFDGSHGVDLNYDPAKRCIYFIFFYFLFFFFFCFVCLFVCYCNRGGFNEGDNGTSLVLIKDIDEKLIAFIVHGGCYTRIDPITQTKRNIKKFYGAGIDVAHKLMEYPQITVLDPAAAPSEWYENTQYQKRGQGLQIQGIPSEFLSKEDVIIPNEFDVAMPRETHELKIRGIPMDLLPSNATLVSPDMQLGLKCNQ